MRKTDLRRRGLLLTGFAALAASAMPAHADPTPTAPIQQLTDGLLRVMKTGPGTPFKQRFDMLAPVIDQVFDLDAVLRTSVGPEWASLPPDQQDMLRPAFRRYTVASYVNNFNSFNGQQFTVEPQTRPVGNGEQVVLTRITSPSGDSHELDYVMRNTGSGLARGGRSGGWLDQPGRGPAIGFPSAALPRRGAGAGGEPDRQVAGLVGRSELSGTGSRPKPLGWAKGARTPCTPCGYRATVARAGIVTLGQVAARLPMPAPGP